MSVFDRSVALHHTGDDAGLLREILWMFLQQGPERMAQVESALARGEARELEQGAHALKGTAATLGMEPLREAAHAVERLGREGRFEGAAGAVGQMRAAMEAALAAVRRELS